MNWIRLSLLLALSLTALPAFPSDAPAASETIDFASDRWMRYNGDVIEHLGRSCLIGSATLLDAAFENGIIEFDLAVNGSRGYPGITFRATSRTTYEHIYIRPHAGLRNDGLQYAPAFGPGSDWQLYNGDGSTSSVRMPHDEWVHVRVEILGRRARVFYGDGEAALEVRRLQHEPAAGAVGVRSARDLSACFSNFTITKTDDLEFGAAPAPLQPRGLVAEWEISQGFKAADVDGAEYPGAELLDRIEWTRVPAEPNGLLNLSRHVTRSANGETDLVFARVFLEATEAETRRFSFGYSDVATLFLNGRQLFTGNSSYLSRSPDYAGIISLEDSVYLSLKPGRNELLFAVMESFGGWGLMGQDNADDLLAPGLKKIWSIETGNRLPESALYDAKRDLLYVTQYFRGGEETISKVSLDGEVIESEWIVGLRRPTGMFLRDDRLWVVDRRNLVEIDVDAGEIVDVHAIPDAVFPNDVTFDDRGDAYVSDTRGNKIYRFHDDEFEVWLEGDEVQRPNGLLADGDVLLFGESDSGRLRRVRFDDKSVTTLAELGDGANVDGMRPDGAGNVIVSDFNGRVYRVTPAGELTTLLDTTASGATSADLEFIVEKQILIVPGLFDNRLTAYRLGGS